VTVQNEYLSISGIEVWTGEEGEVEEGDDEGSSTTISASGPSTKISLEKPSMNKPYSSTSYKAEWALEGGKRTAITAKGVGNWWKASFVGGPAAIERVRVKNRHDCCGERLTGTKITINGQVCGSIPATGNGKWAEVKCSRPIVGTEI
jgi:hypothetical protein